MKNKVILELYTAIQSEGSRAGFPTVVVRTTGCTHRCYFNNGGWCDTWYSSIHPEKGLYDIEDVKRLYDKNPQIKEMMITGGSPTMHPDLLEDLTTLANERGIFTTIETEGSHFVKTTNKIDLISLSPKFSNSIPLLGIKTPMGKIVDKKMIEQHNKFRLNKEVIKNMLDYHNDYHFKPVWDGSNEVWVEIMKFKMDMNIPRNKTWIMPAGDTRDELIKMYPIVMEKCVEFGLNFTSREHIIAYDTKRSV
jgi:7-carboxy-7-deazaguanine synthase